jgi:hypothetical protein
MTQSGSVLVAVALALTAYFAIAAWQATGEDRREATSVMMWESPETLMQQ